MRILGIETTCDETAAAVVGVGFDGRGEILSNEVLSQIAEHARYGGVVPEIAARAHVEVIDRLVARALKNAGCSIRDIDGIAAAAGPGLIGGVLIGLTTAKSLSLVTRKPLMAVNHLEAHALTARLTDGIGFPYLLLLASGGHTQLVAVRGGRVKVSAYHSAAGNYVVIDAFNDPIDHAYMHLARPASVDKGDRVYTNQQFGVVGTTGSSTACHLHFEMWGAPGWYTGGTPIDPLPSLKAWDAYS